MDNFVVNSKFLARIRNDKNADRSRSTAECLLETRPEMTLIDHFESLLNFASLSHGNELSIFPDINQAILLEDGAKKRMENDRRGWVRNNARLFVQLLGKQVDTEVTMLSGLGWSGNTNDLTWPVLKDNEIANTDVVTRNRESGRLGNMDGGDMTRFMRIFFGFVVLCFFFFWFLYVCRYIHCNLRRLIFGG